MPGVYDSVSSLPSPDSDYTDSSPLHPKEIIIRIYASDEQGRFFATAPVPPPTPPDTTGSSGSDQEREREKQKQATPPLRRKLSKAARLRSKEESPKPSSGSVSRSFSNPIKQLNHSKSAESFRQACEAARQTPHRASQPPQQLQRQDSRVHTPIRRKAVAPQNNEQGTGYDPNVFSHSGTSASPSGTGSRSGTTDVPVFGSCDKRVRRNRSYESNMTPPSKRGRSKTLDRYAVDHNQSPVYPVVDEAPPPPVPAKDVYNQVYGQTFGQDHSYGYGHGHGVPAEPLPNLSLEQFRKDIGWPSAVDVNDTAAAAAATTTTTTTNTEELLPATRYSGISPIPTTESSSIDDPLQPENWGLRYPERQSSLMGWEFGSPHRLLHKAGRISEEDRQSIAANFDSFADQTSEGPKRRVDVVPVVVIPQRQSSLCYPATQAAVPPPPGNNIPSRPQESDRRPSTVAGDWARSSGQTPQQTGFPHGITSRSQSARRPVVPPRRSSLSAPTSANNSRAASLTSDSLRSHTILMREDEFKRYLADKPIPHIPSEPLRPSMFGLTDDDTQTQSILIGIEDVDRIGAASVPLSHLSHGSAPSSPGVVEVDQATAVNLYPHNNESLLVVDRQHNPYQNPNPTFNQNLHPHHNQNVPLNPLNQNPLNPNRKPINRKEVPAPAPGSALSPSKTRSPRVEFAPVYEGESPKHPQPPPNTPICHVTPPSPNPPPPNKAHEPMLSRFGSLRRAWSTRTRTQPMRTQPTSAPKRSFSTSATENRKDGGTTNTTTTTTAATKPPESRLHPFWRPRRGKIDTQPDKSSLSPSPMHPPTSNTKQNDNIVKNSLGMPQPRAVIDGPSLPARTRSRRETNQRQRPQPPPSTNVKRKPLPLSKDPPNGTAVAHSHARSNSSRTLNGSAPDFINRASRASRQLNLRQCQGHHHPVTWGYRVRFGTVRNLRRRFRGRMQKQKESEQREKLRRNIGGMAQVDAVRKYQRGYPSHVGAGAGVPVATGAAGAGVGGRRRRERLTKRR